MRSIVDANAKTGSLDIGSNGTEDLPLMLVGGSGE